MDRRTFLKSTALAALALPHRAAGPDSARAATPLASPYLNPRPTRDLVMSTPYDPISGGLADSAFRLAKRIERTLDGGVQIHIISSGGKASVAALASGEAEIHFGSEHGNISHAPAIAYFAGLPGSLGAEGQAMSRWIWQGGGQVLWERCLRPYGIQPLLAQHTGARGGLWVKNPAGAFSGVKVSAEGLSAEVFRALGADVSCLTIAAAAKEVTLGTLDAVELDTLEDALASGISDDAKTCVLASPRGNGSVLSLSIKIELWEQFTARQRMQFKTIAQKHERNMHEEARTNAALVVATMQKTRGTRFLDKNHDHAETISRLSEAIVADISSRDGMARSVTAAFQRYFRPG